MLRESVIGHFFRLEPWLVKAIKKTDRKSVTGMRGLSMQYLFKMNLVMAIVFGLTGCGGIFSASNSSGAGALLDIFWPKADISDSKDGWVDGMDAGDGMVGSGKWDNRFFIDFSGVELTASDSFIIEKAGIESLSIPAFAGSDLGTSYNDDDTATVRDEIFAGITTAFAGVDVELLTEEPSSGPYSTVYIGGSNFTGTDNVLGVAPLDFNNFSGEDLIFVFSEAYEDATSSGSKDILINVAAHEIAHSIGARHIDSDDATLNPVVRSDTDSFDVSADVVGEDDDEENTKDLLVWTVGAADGGDPAGLPTIVDLAMVSDGDVGQLSIYSPANAAANPDLNFNSYEYDWSFDGRSASGPTVRILFEGEVGSTFGVQLTVSSSDGSAATYDFKINKK